jgi:hypothetical protein
MGQARDYGARFAAAIFEFAEGVGLTDRQHLLLNLLDAIGGSVGDLDFQKVLFLYCQRPESGRPYEFVPYKRGAFSFTSYADRRKLIALGLIEDDEHRWKVTAKGIDSVRPNMLLTAFAEGLNGMRGDELIADTYRRFPYYATRSEIADRVLKGDQEALARIEAAKSSEEPRFLQTIGYEGRSLEAYLNLLLKAQVSLLCDVRRNPLSRKYGFAKSTLANACTGVGMRYEHMPELGIASDKRQDLRTQKDYDLLFDSYERDCLPTQTESLRTIGSWIERGERVALTCYELHPNQCHRHCVAEALEAMCENRFGARHL